MATYRHRKTRNWLDRFIDYGWLTCVGVSFGFEYIVVTEILRGLA